MRPETILEEAQRLVYGDREQAYDHPARDFDRTARMWRAYLAAKGCGHVDILPEDVGWMMVLLKMAREMHLASRENRVDAAGYVQTVDRIHTGN